MTRVEQQEKTEERVSPQGKRILGIDRSTGLFMPIVSGSHVVLLSSSWRYAQVELDAISPYENPDLICQNTIIGLKRAKHLIASGETNLKEIARRVGFFDANRFKRHFKRIYHVSPSVFLRHISESDLGDLDPDLPLV